MSGTIKVLNVAEKPSVAKSVSGILSGSPNLRSREGRSRYNRIFEFNYLIRGHPCQMIFTSVTGHLMETEFDEQFRKWHSCDPADLFHAPVRKFVPEEKKDVKRTLEEEARKCNGLVLWLDCDREGENIAFEVIDVCRAVNCRLVIRRARFSALIDRFQTMLLRDMFNIDVAADTNLVLSYGPCQFPTLGFVVERYWEIQSHEPEEFWTINCSHKSDEGTTTFSWMRGHLFDHSSAVIIYEMSVLEPTATVTKVHQAVKQKYPPHPLSTIELEKRASRFLRMSSEHTMKVAEELYQSGFISYPRTETDSFSGGTDLHTMVREQQGHPEWGSYVQRLLNPEAGLWRNPRGGGHDDKAHPPIHPTKFSTGEPGWSRDHSRLYELVVRRFLACVSQPAVGAETTAEVDIAGELFSAAGRVILDCRNVVWLPGSLMEASVTRNICSSCNPGCISGCDDVLRELIDACGTGSRMSGRGPGSAATPGKVQRRNTRQSACIYCQQTGHASTDCPSRFSASQNSHFSMNPQNGESSVSCSTCGTPCVLRTANTANNRGRKFYSCPSHGCNFFVWEDNVNNASGGRGAGINGQASNTSTRGGRGCGRGRGRSENNRTSTAAGVTFVSATGELSGRRCYVCNDPSHFANVCPNRGM